jgi:hypothetical protein
VDLRGKLHATIREYEKKGGGYFRKAYEDDGN